MKDGEHYHNQGDSGGKHNHRKLAGLILIAVIFALVAYGAAQIAQTTADNNANITNIFEIVVNNTNLAPDAGAPHPFGTGERLSGNLYWANDSPIQILLFSHANTAGQNGQIRLEINKTEVLNTAIRPIGVAENTNTTISAIIPKGSNYSATFNNYHHYEWREYPILSGRNGTLSLNQTFVTNGSSFNATYDAYGSSKVNKSGDISTGTQFFTDNNLLNFGYISTRKDSNVITFGVNSSNATNVRLQVDNYSAHIGLNIGNTSNSAVTVELNQYNDSLIDIRGRNQLFGTDFTENTLLYMNRSGFTIKSEKGNITLDAASGFVNYSGDAIRNVSQILIGTNENNIPSTSTTFRNMRVLNNNVTPLGFSEFVSLSSSPRALFLFRTAKGYETAPLPVVVGDYTGEIVGGGWVGNTGEFSNNAAMSFKVDTGTVSDVSLPGKIIFETAPDGSTSRLERVSINNTGHVKMNTYSGTGEGFVCFDPNGVIFRKETACASDG